MLNKRQLLFTLLLISAAALQECSPAYAQTPATGTITVNSTLTAVGVAPTETLTCTIGPTVSRNGATINCSRGSALGTLAQHNEDISLPGQSNTWTLNLNGNAMSVMLTQSAPVGTITYQVNMNGTMKAGTF